MPKMKNKWFLKVENDKTGFIHTREENKILRKVEDVKEGFFFTRPNADRSSLLSQCGQS